MKAEDQSAERDDGGPEHFARQRPFRDLVNAWLRETMGSVEADNVGKPEFMALVQLAERAALSAREAPAREGWQPIETAPKCFAIPRLLWTPMRNGKLAEALPLCGYWMEPFWVIVNADAAIQRVEPTHWMPIPAPPVAASPQAPTTDPAPPAAKAVEMDALSEFLEFWTHEGRLQTFEDRERFRGAARALLGGNHG